jgi:hypothetical protein
MEEKVCVPVDCSDDTPEATSIANGIREATEAIRGFGKMAAAPRSKHTAGHAGEKQRRKERTRAKNRAAKISRRRSR